MTCMVDHGGRVTTIEVNMEMDPLHWIQCIIAVTMGSLFLKADDPPSDDLKLKFKLGPILISQSLRLPHTDSLAGTFYQQ